MDGRRVLLAVGLLMLSLGLAPGAQADAPETCVGEPATIVGTKGRDRIVGTLGRDVIAGLGGRDTIDAADGDDLVCGGNGRDVLVGGSGDDRLSGENGKDDLFGGEGADQLEGGRGSDRCDGGPGADLLSGCERGPGEAPEPPGGLPQLPVQPYYLFPRDQPFHPEYVAAINALIDETRAFFLEHTGKELLVLGLRVVQAPDDYLTMRCGAQPAPECRDERQQLPNWLGAVAEAVGGFPPRQATWVFSQGGGGFAGGNLFGDFTGFAVTGDFTLEGISGVPEPAGIPCTFATFQCEGTYPEGAAVHELGHALQLHHPGPFTFQPSFMGDQGNFPAAGLLPYEAGILAASPFLGPNAFDPEAPFLFLENPDEVPEGEVVELTGRGFAVGDVVEFTDADRTVSVVPEVLGPDRLRVRVPDGAGSGFVRLRRGSLLGNPLTVNVDPARIPQFPVQPFYVLPADHPFHPEYASAIEGLIADAKAFFRAQTGRDLLVEPLRVARSDDDYLTMRCGVQPTPACRDDPSQFPNWFNASAVAVGGSFLAFHATWVFSQGSGGFAQSGVIGESYAGFAITGDFTLEGISGVPEPAGLPCTPTTVECQGSFPSGSAVHHLAHALGLLEPSPSTPGPTIMRDPGAYPAAGLLPHERVVLAASPFLRPAAFALRTPTLNPPGAVLLRGQIVELAGRGFAPGDTVEFTDAARTVTVVPETVEPEKLRIRVPDDARSGFIRVRRGALDGNPVAVNVEPA